MKKSVTIWLTGLTASGKTTLSKRLKDDLLSNGIDNVELLDGEDLREKIKNFKYLTEDRNAIGFQKALLALEHYKKGKIVIVTGIAHHKETRQKIRKYFDHYIEVYLKCSVEECSRRDYKGHYKKAFAGKYDNFIGVTEPYQVSNSSDLVLETGNKSIDECAALLLEYVLNYLNDKIY